MTPILNVRGLTTSMIRGKKEVPIVDDVSFSLEEGETLALVGESGCGKSMTSLSVMRLLPDPPMRIVGGSIEVGGTDITKLGDREMRNYRGKAMSMIFQEPMNSLNPIMSVGAQLVEAIKSHRGLDGDAARKEAVNLLRMVRIADPERRIAEYPHRLSGGMRQRVMIAMAMATIPQILIADEPTTALDVTIQAQILKLLKSLQEEHRIAMLLVSHDLGLVSAYADRVAVMYAGRIVEMGPVDKVLNSPEHPYTVGLLAARPSPRTGSGLPERLPEIPGRVPAPSSLPAGCVFSPRCPRASGICLAERPELAPAEAGHDVRCFHPGSAEAVSS